VISAAIAVIPDMVAIRLTVHLFFAIGLSKVSDLSSVQVDINSFMNASYMFLKVEKVHGITIEILSCLIHFLYEHIQEHARNLKM
jgi:hypothetical protein